MGLRRAVDDGTRLDPERVLVVVGRARKRSDRQRRPERRAGTGAAGGADAQWLRHAAQRPQSTTTSSWIAAERDHGQQPAEPDRLVQHTDRVEAQSGDRSAANDLLDARNNALDQLSPSSNYQSTTRSDGSVAVYLGGNTVVDGGTAQQLSATNGQPATLSINGVTGLALQSRRHHRRAAHAHQLDDPAAS